MTTSRPGSSPSIVAGARLAATTLLGRAGVPRLREVAVANAARLNDTLPVHSKWWRERATLDGDDSDLRYVAIGDSAAQGIGASHPSRGYVGRIAEAAGALTGRPVEVRNLAVSGATTALAVRDQLPRLATLEADLVTVSIGANDIASWDPAAFDRNLAAILDAVPPHAIVADLPCFHLPWNDRKVAMANRMVRAAAARRGLAVVPLHERTHAQRLRSILTQFADDMFHPNDAGYEVWAGAFAPAVEASLRSRGLAAGGRTLAGSGLAAAVTADVGGRG